MKQPPTHLIIGCGYLGKRLRALLDERYCWSTKRTGFSSSQKQTTNDQSLLIDINKKETWANLEILSKQKDLIIYCMVPPSKLDINLFPEFLARISQLDSRRHILISSTVVYGNSDRTVDSDSDVEIDSDRAKRQYQIEQVWSKINESVCIVRLAGIHGPDRVIGRNSILNNHIIKAEPEGWLNLIHVDDAACLIKCIGDMDKFEQISLGCDGYPVKRKDYYAFLAKKLDYPMPEFEPIASRGLGRRCDNALTIKRTGWQPRYKNYKQALSVL